MIRIIKLIVTKKRDFLEKSNYLIRQVKQAINNLN